MAQDFAKRRSNNGRRAKKGGNSGPIWLVTGLLCGFFLAFLLQLAGVSLVPNNADRVAAPVADSELNTTNQERGQPAKKPRFEFYALLPEAKVEVQEEAEVPVAESSSSTALKNTEQSKPLASTRRDTPATNATRYVLQAGSFKSHSDADRLRARLLLMGLEASIEKVRLSGTDNRHRVHVGPFVARAEMLDARKQLTKARIDTLLLERKIR